MSTFNWRMRACGIFLLWATLAVALPAQTLTTLHTFENTDGYLPEGLIQGTDGNLYGTTIYGGVNEVCLPQDYSGCGTVFKITPSGLLTTLYSFCSQSNCTDGEYPFAGLVQATNGKFYGTTFYGGADTSCTDGIIAGCGTVFEITARGTLTTLHSFHGADGRYPDAGLVQGTDGGFFGTTVIGGPSHPYCSAGGGCGTVFKITPSGRLTTLHNFDSTDGYAPYAGLVQGADGNFYGTTSQGGINTLCGTVFKITPSGTLTTLHNFAGTDGCSSAAGLIQGSNGSFYGTTIYGGVNNELACGLGCGTVFKITPSGAFTTLYNFCSQLNCTDGYNSAAGLVQATDGNFYGTTGSGGANSCAAGCGTVFTITPSGTLTTLHSFDGRDGSFPNAGLVQGTNGNLYGTTSRGGGDGTAYGTVFSLSVGLGPFVETNPAAGEVGAAVKILGTKLTGATSVTFNGTAATFTVISSSEITTTVPSGATTGTVQVVTPSGTLSSNVPFRVK